MKNCSISRRPKERRSWRREDRHGRVRAEICRRARAGAPAGSLGRLGEGTARPLFGAGLPDLFGQNQSGGDGDSGGRKKLNLEKFLIFNQQFVTLIRAGLPILKGLDLL